MIIDDQPGKSYAAKLLNNDPDVQVSDTTQVK
jgi:hypothetical protein